MTFNRSSILAAAMVAGLSFVAASAANAMRGDFTAADANHDGKVTLAEFRAYATQQLSAAPGPRAQQFKQLSPQQQQAVLKQRFDQADSDHKGYLTQQDWSGS